MNRRHKQAPLALIRSAFDLSPTLLETPGIFFGALGLLLCFGAFAPFTKELGACESGAVREVLAGNFILPHYRAGGSIVWVPPFSWWTQALAVKALGWREVALRLPSLMGAAFTCALLYGWLRSSVSRPCALWSVAALLSCRFFVDAARQPRQDALFLALASAAIICFARGRDPKTSRPITWLAAASTAIALATLTKGPLGLVLPGLAIAVWMLVEERVRELFKPAPLVALGCALMLASVWYAAAYAVGDGEFVQVQIVTCLWDRFTGKLDMCRHPFYYFWPYVITGFLPWSLLLPFVGISFWQDRRTLPTPIKLAASWFLGFLAFLSASSGKCLAYLVPVFPPLAVLTGWAIARFLQDAEQSGAQTIFWRLGTLLAGASAAVLALTIGGLGIWGTPDWLIVRLHPSDRKLVMLLTVLAHKPNVTFVIWLVALIVAGIFATGGALTRRPRMAFFSLALTALAGTAFWFGDISPALARKYTLKPFIRETNSIVPPGAALAYMGEPDCDASFYSRRQLSVQIERPPACGTHPTLYFIAPEDIAARLKPGERACLREIAASHPVDTHGRRLLFVTR